MDYNGNESTNYPNLNKNFYSFVNLVFPEGTKRPIVNFRRFFNYIIAITIFILSNIIEAMILTTGAFEIFYMGELIWSKLKMGRFPEIDYVLNTIRHKITDHP
ncbi:hypothetical protein HZS_4705 [Henneguya salminicola]|nr:hypothetical protein HZS_4705 [Henneguya salminicola]